MAGPKTGSTAAGGMVFRLLLVALGVGVAAGARITVPDGRFGIAEMVGKMHDVGLAKLADVREGLGDKAEARYRQLARSQLVQNPDRNIDRLSTTLTQFW